MLASPAAGQQRVCDFRDKLLGHLAQKYQESPVAVGASNDGSLVEVLATNDGETWTIVVTRPDGWACMRAAGENWRTIEPKPESTAL
ncbi:hypothetical protein LCGC14_2876660 [marine sediment metagenome]|uniref:Uncharacterized protein n=1 Tax=marine sediment metagenome TaxID=412755 RepID=A0A0F8YN33_9ZZZZ